MVNWIIVASADHANRGVAEGFIQVNHGKSAHLRRFAAGDVVAIYAPYRVYGGKDRLQSFVALGRVRPGEPYIGDMGGGFTPWRRNMDWMAVQPAPIAPLLQHLNLTAGKPNWGAHFRFGLIKIDDRDIAMIASSMGHILTSP